MDGYSSVCFISIFLVLTEDLIVLKFYSFGCTGIIGVFCHENVWLWSCHLINVLHCVCKLFCRREEGMWTWGICCVVIWMLQFSCWCLCIFQMAKLFLHSQKYRHVYRCAQARTHTRIHSYMCFCTRTHTHTQTHTHTHTQCSHTTHIYSTLLKFSQVCFVYIYKMVLYSEWYLRGHDCQIHVIF